MKKTVLHITTVGNALWFVEGYANVLQEKQMNMAVVSTGDHAFEAFCQAENVKGFSCDMKRQITPIQDIRAVRELVGIIYSVGPVIVHTHTPKASLLGMIASYLAGVPVRIYQVHGLPIETASGLRKWLLWLSDVVAVRLATQALAVSQSVASQMINYKICTAKDIKVLASGSISGVDLNAKFVPDRTQESQAEARRMLGIPTEGIVFGFVGRLVPDKGIRELIIAWQKVSKDYEHVHLVVAGDEESHDPLADDIRKELVLNITIHKVGFVANTKRIYQAMDVLILPTYREGLPTVLLEAAAMGKPVIASSATGCIDVVIENTTGLFTKIGDAEDLSKKIGYYINNPEKRAQHGKAARSHVEQHYTREQVQEKFIEEYQRLLKIYHR